MTKKNPVPPALETKKIVVSQVIIHEELEKQKLIFPNEEINAIKA